MGPSRPAIIGENIETASDPIPEFNLSPSGRGRDYHGLCILKVNIVCIYMGKDVLVGRDQEIAIARLDDPFGADCQKKEEPNNKPKTVQ
jgi:hypothetical protein